MPRRAGPDKTTEPVRWEPSGDGQPNHRDTGLVASNDRNCGLGRVFGQPAPAVGVIHGRERVELSWVADERVPVGEVGDAVVLG